MLEKKIKTLEFENQLLQTQLKRTGERFEEKIFELSFVKEVALSLLSTTDFGQTCRNILDVITRNAIVQNCSIMLIDQDKDQLFLVAASGPEREPYVLDAHQIFSKDEIRYCHKVGEGVAGNVALTKEPILATDLNQSPDLAFDVHTTVTIGSLLSLPLVVEDMAIGVVNLSHARKNIFVTDQINLFSIIANYIAMSIYTAIGHEKLKYSEHKYRTLTESSYDGIAILRNGMHSYANSAYQKIVGYTHDELKELSFAMLVDPSNEQSIQEDVKSILNAKVPNYHLGLRILGREQRKVDLEINSSPITHEGSDAVLISARDLTVRKQLELQLQHAQKMEAIGTLAGGMAHEFRNVLQLILGLTELLLTKKTEHHPDYLKLSRILQSIERANQLTYQLLTFSRRIESAFKQVDLNELTEKVLELLRNTFPKMIDIQLHLSPDLHGVRADPAQIEQIIMNLCINARDAMPQGGQLILTTENVHFDESFCKNHLGAVPGEYACLSVSDTGWGMDPQTQEHIFEPFFTTKEIGRGTGLGLAIVYGIVKNHGGYIFCHSRPGQGTTFLVHLPAMQEVQGSRGMALADSQKNWGGNETLLLVDDEELILESTRDLLEHYGYKVLTADQGEKAIALLHNKGVRVDLVLLDLNMPGMGGRKCFAEMRRTFPATKIMITSGYPVKGDIRKLIEGDADGFISKPYKSIDLLKKLREILALC
jgi:two-component system, cell cycle sensor histidine kinase and response regulator CckA